jgi:hypothetical protein
LQHAADQRQRHVVELRKERFDVEVQNVKRQNVE